MSSHPGVKKTLELLENLRAALADCAAAEEKLSHEFRIRLGKERQRREELTDEEAKRVATETAEAQEAYHSAKEAEDARYAARKACINRARASSKEQTLERIENRTGNRKYELQRLLMESERKRDADFANAGTEYQEFNANLAGELGALDALEKKARNSFRGYGSFRRLISRAQETALVNPAPDQNQLMGEMRTAINKASGELDRFRRLIIPMLFSFLPIWLLLPLCATPLVLQHFKIGSLTQTEAIGISIGAAVAISVLYFLGKGRGSSSAKIIADALGKARKLYTACLEKSEAHYREENQRIQNEFTVNTEIIDAELKAALKNASAQRGSFREAIDDKTVRITSKNEQRHRAK
ncbi:MAG TPA: hypothetical protein VG754_08125, partial [Verrucomicrobiae bacterium]|nr:hypothetical protein [Verrucomicrobiae bacterium]